MAEQVNLNIYTNFNKSVANVVKGLSNLTERQYEVLSCMQKGLSFPEISKMLNISQGVARKHAVSIYKKAGVHSREDLMKLIRSKGNEHILKESEIRFLKMQNAKPELKSLKTPEIRPQNRQMIYAILAGMFIYDVFSELNQCQK